MLATYSVLLILSLHEDFREQYKEGAFLAFQNLLMVAVFFVICYGLWMSGYKEGLNNGKN